MKKLFVSQPMKDKTDEEIKKVREQAKADVEERIGEEVELIDSVFEAIPHDAKPLWVLGRSFEFLSMADIVYFAKGWENSRGCDMEHTASVEYEIESMYEEESESES